MARWARSKLFFCSWQELKLALSLFPEYPKIDSEPKRGRPYADPDSVIQWAVDRHREAKSWGDIARDRLAKPTIPGGWNHLYANGRSALELASAQIKRAVGRLQEVEQESSMPAGTMMELHRTAESAKWAQMAPEYTAQVMRQVVAGSLIDPELQKVVGNVNPVDDSWRNLRDRLLADYQQDGIIQSWLSWLDSPLT